MPAKKKTAKDTLTAADGLAIAIQTELEGFEFYKLAAQKSKDDGAKKMFESLGSGRSRPRTRARALVAGRRRGEA